MRTKKLGIAGLSVVLLTKKKIPIVSKNIIVEGIKVGRNSWDPSD